MLQVLGLCFLFEVLVNVGMTTGIMPVTGIPLPFISYGVSALTTNLLSIGLLLNIVMRQKKTHVLIVRNEACASSEVV